MRREISDDLMIFSSIAFIYLFFPPKVLFTHKTKHYKQQKTNTDTIRRGRGGAYRTVGNKVNCFKCLVQYRYNIVQDQLENSM